ncbi:tetratricopeptide repeat protein [Azospirillum halopraeferens]|uniref:tetratricopeptide repeat protein n=1 Tax=Azospirillum halopraeferens TaxID=34010 RepID=UPI0006871485|nr:tetratricopeptide repeat protein [Azospirillum halopraeferens]
MIRLPSLLAAVTAVILALAPPASARQDDARLDTLFRVLQDTRDDAVAQATQDAIRSIWLEHPGPEIRDLMEEGVQYLFAERFTDALAMFDRVVDLAPDYAEGWNRRANTHYLMGDYAAAVADIRTALELEPRHFPALAGLGLIYLAIDEPGGALRAFDGALSINPHLKGVRARADELRSDLAGEAL